MTPCSTVFDFFLSLVTDDLYTVFDERETEADLLILLRKAIVRFNYPKHPIAVEGNKFTEDITDEEAEILANIMFELWLQRKIQDQKLIAMEYGDKDFAIKSQANHLDKLNSTLAQTRVATYHLKTMYNRKKADGKPNFEWVAGANYDKK